MADAVESAFPNCDNWGAAEWFERMANAVMEQDKAVAAGDTLRAETYRMIAASSGMELVRGFRTQIRAALSSPATPGSEPSPAPTQGDGNAVSGLLSVLRQMNPRLQFTPLAPVSEPSPSAGEPATEPPYRPFGDLLDWAGGRWEAEVKNRPLGNVHRRALDTTWRQVIRKLGADPEALFGPAHDDLVDATPPATPVQPTTSVEGAHPDDLAVDRFAAVMKAKLAKKRAQGRGGWEDKNDCSNAFLSQLLREHVDKGDPVDVGNLAMMIHQRGESIATPPAPSGEGHGLCGISADIESKRVLKLHFKHEVTDADRKAIIDAFNALNRERRALSNPAPGHGEAVPVAWRPVGQVEIDYDGFAGTIQGYYTTREGKHGVVVQQHGTRVVHVYGEKSIARLNAAHPAEKPAKQEDGDV